jgi:hypothetical protein
LGGVVSCFWMEAITLERDERVLWMSLSLACVLLLADAAGFWLSFSSSCMVRSAIKDLRCGRIPNFQAVGLYSLIWERRKEKVPFGSWFKDRGNIGHGGG